MKDYVAAIDLGTTKIVALIGKNNGYGKYHIVASYEAPSVGIQRGEVQNVLKVTTQIKSALQELKHQSGIDVDEIYIGIAGQHISCACERGDIMRDYADVEISQSEIDSLLKKMYSMRMEPGENVLHVIPQSFNIDDKMDVQDPVGMTGKRLEGNFHIVIGKTQASEIVNRCIKNQGGDIKLKRLVLEPLASAAAVLTDDEKEAGVAMVDIGGGTTDLVVYHNNVVQHSAVIPFGGNAITNDIKLGCGVLQRHAEEMKVQYGSCFSDLAPANKVITIPGISGRESREISFKSLANCIQARMEEILGAIVFEIERSGYADKLAAGIVFTGGGSLLSGLPQLTKLKTGYDVRIARPMYLTADSGNDLVHPAYSTVVGLIIKGFEYEQKDMLAESEASERVEENVLKPIADEFMANKKDNKKPIFETEEQTEEEKNTENDKPRATWNPLKKLGKAVSAIQKDLFNDNV